MCRYIQAIALSFNPRAPHGARRRDRRRDRALQRVSIHAPRTGRDHKHLSIISPIISFNPRAPHGARPVCRGGLCSVLQFQSTRPARGATKALYWREGIKVVSIHAPRTGRDSRTLKPRSWPYSFNPRAPHGARRGPDKRLLVHPGFNPRAPHGARHWLYRPRRTIERVSIHAPRTGRDIQKNTPDNGSYRFNPRAPHGARPAAICMAAVDKGFQSTRPARGATWCDHHECTGIGCFNPRAPHGARPGRRMAFIILKAFQSTRPARGATT